jgi:peptidoglycan/LPS O-acetylase OafA/YrhL
MLLGLTFLGIYFFANKGLWSTAPMMVTIGVSVVAATFTGLIILALDPSTSIARQLDITPMRFFGKYSYGLYVIHGALGPLLATAIPTGAWIAAFNGWTLLAAFLLAAIKIAICTGLAIVSYHFYEVRFLRLKRFFERTPNEARSDSLAA